MTTATLTFTPACGPIRGWEDGAVIRATGIPYASADRFALPTAVGDWTEPFEATTPSPACPQVRSRFLTEVLGDALGDLDRDEHCQRLSVTLPRDAGADELLPVMVWIHGGSYTTGAGDAPIMDPARLVAEQRVVVVAVTYRLGLFGYLGSGPDRPANLGLLDQIQALHWVQRNISAFSGDPDRVTLFGQSSGGDAVAHLMATREAASLFHRAILQSPPLGISRGRHKMNEAMAQAAEVVNEDMSAEEVVALQTDIQQHASSFGLLGQMAFGTQYGHPPLPAESEIEAAWDRAAPHIDVLIGHTAEEAQLYLPTVPVLVRIARFPLMGPLICRAVSKYVTAAVYSRSVHRFAKRHARAGGSAYTYLLSWAAPGNPYGAAHTIDLPLLLGTKEAWAGSRILAGASWENINANGKKLRELWADFARGSKLKDSARIQDVLTYRKVSRV